MAKIREPLLQQLGGTSAVNDRLQSRENQTRLDQQRIYARLNITPSQLKQFCKAHHIVELSLFGSVLRDDFRADSDIDVMVVFDRRANPNLSLMDLVGIQYQLEDWIGRKVDLIEKRSIVNSHNAIRRNNILNTAQIIYESRSVLCTGY
jgi:predicted nucleotidyltransferase